VPILPWLGIHVKIALPSVYSDVKEPFIGQSADVLKRGYQTGASEALSSKSFHSPIVKAIVEN